ncbi:MAG: PPC domain-containing protein [Candidatus Eisenbacteria bacterium]|uniref:PPC domain-containing protein n=1 Tax=Eiseniibacteriota bacterium TaxID=2212470 RepID=A0A933SD00_UNCEI|nr:PPC domain-containing protein [Candidatus Eisenbacteria bacterium]
MRPLLTLAFVVMALAIAGCGGGGSSSTTPPAGNTETEPNDFASQSMGTLAGSDITFSGSAASNADGDLYSVTLGATTNLLVSLNWSNANDLELSISNSAGIFVRTVDTAGHPEACTLAGLPAGTYTIRVGSFSNTATPYTLTVGSR